MTATELKAAIDAWVEKYIRQTATFSAGGVLTAARLNELFNLLITQGDNASEAIAHIRDFLTAYMQDIDTRISQDISTVFTTWSNAKNLEISTALTNVTNTTTETNAAKVAANAATNNANVATASAIAATSDAHTATTLALDAAAAADTSAASATAAAETIQQAVEDLEINYAPRLTTVESGLAQIETQKATKAEVEIERQRTNQIVANPGSTSGDLALNDIKVGDNGITYNSPGDAVRGQINNLKSDINGVNIYLLRDSVLATTTPISLGLSLDTPFHTHTVVLKNTSASNGYFNIRLTKNGANTSVEKGTPLVNAGQTLTLTVPIIPNDNGDVYDIKIENVNARSCSVSVYYSYKDHINNRLASKKYTDIKDTIANIFSSFSTFGPATISGMVATVNGQNGGMMTNKIISTGNKISVKLKGTFTVQEVAIQVKITKVDTTTVYKLIKTIPYTDGVIDTEISFDPTYYAVYENGASYNVIINSYLAGTGQIALTSIVIDDESVFKQFEYYDTDFPTMMQNVFRGIDSAKQLPVSTTSDVFVRNCNGNNYKTQISPIGEVQAIPCVPSSALFMGNSLLLGIANEFGMCASSAEKDYYHYVKTAILAKNASCTFSKLHDALFEVAETDAAADAYFTTNASAFSADLDLIVCQIGDNVNNVTYRATFAKNFPLLLQKIRTASNKARIVVVGVWFNNAEVYSAIESACEKYGCELVDIRDLYITENKGYVGQTYTRADGIVRTVDPTWVSHPGDLGMQRIGDRIISKLNM